jgi:hypothetical protein
VGRGTQEASKRSLSPTQMHCQYSPGLIRSIFILARVQPCRSASLKRDSFCECLGKDSFAEIDSGARWLTSQGFSTTAARPAERQSVYVDPSRPIRCFAWKRCRRQRRGTHNSQEARLCPRPRYKVPSFCPVPGESRRCQPPTGKSRHIFASTEIITGVLRDSILPTITHLRPVNSSDKDAFHRASPATPATD